MSESRDRILGRIQDVGGPRPTAEVEIAFQPSDDLWADFQTFLTALGGKLIGQDELDNALTKLCYVEPAAHQILQNLNLKVENETQDPWTSELGITVADLAIAETGSLVVSAGPNRIRQASLVPPVNLMLVHRGAIVATLNEAMPRMTDRTSVIVTGPSRTADIEGILVKGVHGPAELLVFIHD